MLHAQRVDIIVKSRAGIAIKPIAHIGPVRAYGAGYVRQLQLRFQINFLNGEKCLDTAAEIGRLGDIDRRRCGLLFLKFVKHRLVTIDEIVNNHPQYQAAHHVNRLGVQMNNKAVNYP